MQQDNPPIIADRRHAPAVGATFWWVLGAALGVGLAAAAWYGAHDLTLSHYDARAHLVVARRVLDSLTPGWRQIGAVWLPLPHVLQVWPTQIDWLYQTGWSAVAVSVGALATGLASLAHTIHRRTGSLAGALAAPALVLANPNVLYLQSTPMTEPLLFGLSLMALDTVDGWVASPTPRRARCAGLVLVLLMLTRYEGWCIGLALVALAAFAQYRRGRGARLAVALLPWAAGAIGGFLLLSWITVGRWFVASGFFVPDNPARHDVLAVADQIVSTTVDLSSLAVVLAGATGACVQIWRGRRDAAALLPLALVAAAALPFAAFYQGHPLRIRYMVALVVAAGALAGLALTVVPRRLQAAAAIALLAAAIGLSPPLSSDAAMLHEAQWETPFRIGRAPVTAALDRDWDGQPILASMGSLGHYMQETSAIGLDLHDFLHEGNYYLWDAAIVSPRRYVGWILVEERAEGGDVIAARVRDAAGFLDGFTRVAEGGGVALYRRAR